STHTSAFKAVAFQSPATVHRNRNSSRGILLECDDRTTCRTRIRLHGWQSSPTRAWHLSAGWVVPIITSGSWLWRVSTSGCKTGRYIMRQELAAEDRSGQDTRTRWIGSSF
ncbi:unnamed protein product, partial [Ascophyllum nodosum]